MSQTTYTQTLIPFIEGAITQGRDKADIKDKIVSDSNDLQFGRVVALQDTAGKKVRNHYSDEAKIVLAGDLVASNQVDFDLIINGVTNAISEVFDTTHLQTVQNIETAVELLAGIASLTLSGTNRTLTIQADAETDIYVDNFAVTLGSSQTTGTITNRDTKTPYGISVLEEREPDSNGDVFFSDGQAAGVMRKGYIAVRSDAALNPGDTVYVRFCEEFL